MTPLPPATPPAGWPLVESDPDAPELPELDPDVDVPVGGWRPSRRSRRAEALARIVLDNEEVAAPLRALVRRAAEFSGAEVAQISILSTRQIGVAVQQGSQASTTQEPLLHDGDVHQLENTFCAMSVRAEAPLSIPDTRLDDRVVSLPAVAAGVVGAYLGSPIRVPDGLVVGVLCAFDRGPHEWTTADEREFDLLAAEIGALFDRIQPAEAS